MKKVILLGLISAFADCSETSAMRKLESSLHEELPLATPRSSAIPTEEFSVSDRPILFSVQNADKEMLIKELDKIRDSNATIIVTPEILDFLANPENKEILAVFKARVQSVSIADEVEDIPDEYFANWKNLSRVTFGEASSLKRIGRGAFRGSGLREIHIPDGVEELCERCFFVCQSLSRVTFGSDSSLKHIGREAFLGSGLREIHIPDGVEKLCNECFLGCKSLSRVTFGTGSTLNHINGTVFEDSALREVYAPRNVERLIRQALGRPAEKLTFRSPKQASKPNPSQK